jgi:hypothetical protein
MMIGYDIYDRFTMEHFPLRQNSTMADKNFRPQLSFHLTYALKQPLGTNNLTSHVDIFCQCSYG